MSLAEGLERLHEELVKLVGRVEPMVTRAVASLSKPDPDLVDQLHREDGEIDQREVAIEEECLNLIALHQPVATDLRRIVACLKITGELERIADLAVNVAERAHRLIGQPEIRIPARVGALAELVLGMIRGAIHAYIDGDADAADGVREQDDAVDVLERALIDLLQDEIRANPERTEPVLSLFWATLHLERMGDHATNIAEDVVYMVTGKIVRHAG